jgi:integrase
MHHGSGRSPKIEQQAWTAAQLRLFLRAAAGHRLFPAFWLSAMTGMRRSELLGLRWSDLDLDRATASINRGLVAIGYELHESRGKTGNSRRPIDLDPTTISVLRGWRALQTAEYDAVGIDDPSWVFANAEGRPIHPHAISQALLGSLAAPGVPVIRLHDLRHTHGTLLLRTWSRSRSSASYSATPTSPSPSRPTSTCCPACRAKPRLRPR